MKVKIQQVQLFDVLLVFTICMNAVRFFMNTAESTVSIYGIYIILFALALFRVIGKQQYKKISKEHSLLILFLVSLNIYSIVNAIVVDTSGLVDAGKLLILSMIAFECSFTEASRIKKIINGIIFLNIVYALLMIGKTERIYSFQNQGANYLTMTMTIGLSLTMCISKILTKLYERKNKKFLTGMEKNIFLFQIIASCILFYALTLFTARSSLLFPILALVPFIFLESKFDRKKFIVVFIVACVIAYAGYQLFLNNAEEYILSRMQRLFTSMSEEDRWMIWGRCIELIINNKWYLFGGGINCFEQAIGYYPHNLYIQLVGEYGLIGVSASIGFTYYLTISIFKKMGEVFLLYHNSDFKYYFFQIVTGCLYLWLTYMKSFTLYDSGPLLFFIGLCFSLCKYSGEEINGIPIKYCNSNKKSLQNINSINQSFGKAGCQS